MSVPDIFVTGVGMYLPDRVLRAEDAVGAGEYDHDEHLRNEIYAVRDADGTQAPDLAVEAARNALASGPGAGPWVAALHADLGFQGHDWWTPATYIVRKLELDVRLAAEVRQGSCGGLVAFTLASSTVASSAVAGPCRALVTAADAFAYPYVSRWTSESQQVYGDGAAAVVLGTAPGPLQVVAEAHGTVPFLEEMHRDAEPAAAPFGDGAPIDLRARKDRFLTSVSDHETVISETGGLLRSVVDEALARAGTTEEGVAWLVHPFLGRTVVTHYYRRVLAFADAWTPYLWARSVGHLGAADCLAGLAHLAGEGQLQVGQKVLLAGLGSGFSAAAVLLEVVSDPGALLGASGAPQEGCADA